MQKKNNMTIKFPSHSLNEAFARVAVSAFISQLDPTVEELYDVKMAVSEAVTNSIIHGYEGKEDGEIEIRCSYKEQDIAIEIIDHGKGIADVPMAMTALFTTSGEDERAGLGFTVMQSMMDEVEVYSEMNQGTTIKMKKALGV